MIDPIDMCKASIAGDDLLSFMKYTWMMSSPMLSGVHTIEICNEIDIAIERYHQGLSTYLHIVVPFRHGKSEISSRFLPAYFLGKVPDAQIIQASYGATLSEGFSKDVKKIMTSANYQKVFDVELDARNNNNSERHIKDHMGKYFAVGADGGATGKGADLLIIDDFFKNRKEAESEVKRSARWESLTSDFISRCAPAAIVLVLNTRWHVDDISGHILERTKQGAKHYDPDFPQFKDLHYKAIDDDGKYLWLDRFPESWYRTQRASLGDYGFQSLMQGEPTLRGGNLFKMDCINTIQKKKLPDAVRCRFWDLASTEKERTKDDPDWTVGAQGFYDEDANGLPIFYLTDLKRCQAEAPARNAMIVRTALDDGPSIYQGVESVAGFKDAYTTLAGILQGHSVVHKINATTNKFERISVLEPIIAAGNFYIIVDNDLVESNGKIIETDRGYDWYDPLYYEMTNYPASVHDDMIDAIAGCYEMAKERFQKLQSLTGGDADKGLQDEEW